MKQVQAISPLLIANLLSLFLFCTNASAERFQLSDSVSAGASWRLRYENKDDFKFDERSVGNDENFLLSQIRINLLWNANDWISAFIEGQDAAIQGEDSIDDSTTPNIYADDMDLHQGYVNLKLSSDENSTDLKLGRQKLNYGQQRLVGALEWVNTARVFDAVKLSYGNAEKRSIDLFTSRLVAVNPDDFNDWDKTGSRYFNSEFYGAYYTDQKLIEDGVFELYYLFRHEDVASDSVHTTGTRIESSFGALNLDGEFAYQFGDFGGLDHSAYALHVGARYEVWDEYKGQIGIAYNFGSGDDDATDGDHNTFDNLFPTNHAHYGYMDFFSWQNTHNLEMTIAATALEKLGLRLAWQNFWLAEEDSDAWYNAGLGVVRTSGGADVDPYVGSEIDITAKYPFWDNKLAAELGYSHFFTGDYVKDTGANNDADFVYLQMKLNLN